jgi:hypothetical protein
MKFGHDKQLITVALNELMNSQRPLLWSEDGFHVDDCDSNSRIMTTPIGIGYYNDLFGELFYEEACLAQFGNERINPSDTIEFHQRLTEIDLQESEFAISKYGYTFYSRNYPQDEIISISQIHWNKLLIGLNNINRNFPDINVDQKRSEWIRHQFKSILDSKS